MKHRYLLLSLVVTLASLAFTAWLYPDLPHRIPIHWNHDGLADGFGPRAVLFVHTGLMIGVMLLWWTLPQVSPARFSVARFAPTFWYGCLMAVAMLAYVQCIHAWAVHRGGVDMARTMLTGIALFCALTGNVMGKVRRNFWLGVRTPWTLANERVWYATHRLAARSMVAGAALALLLLLAHAPSMLVVGVLMAALLVPAAFSLVYYKRLERRGTLEA